MQAPNSLHPSDRSLKDYGLGKLDEESAGAVHEHLEVCQDCRQRVAGFKSDAFLGDSRDGQKPPIQSAPDGWLDGGTLSFQQAQPTSPPPPTDTLPPGLANHPDYVIKRELGRGGMGVVYLAHNAMMGRDEVLKVMGRHIMERPGVLERFQREIRAVAKLRHPNIVAAYHAFRIEGGLVFSMEYVEGLDLARLVKTKGPLSVAHAAYFAHHAALGLQHAHEKGLIHRDIKPHNLMLTHDGKARLVKVLDFGLAKANREDKVDGGLTSEGQALGTPDYIAPEQIVNALDVDIRADLYSLGGTLFYLLTGRPPFLATSLYDIYQAHMSREAEPLNLIRPEVPAELAALVARMMAKDPGRRFQNPADVARSLTPFFKRGDEPTNKAQVELSLNGPATEPKTSRSRGKPPGSIKMTAETVDRDGRPSEVTAPQLGWEKLIDFADAERSADPARPQAARGSTHETRWILRLAIAAVSLILFIFISFVYRATTAPSRVNLTVHKKIGLSNEIQAKESAPPRAEASKPAVSGPPDVPASVTRTFRQGLDGYAGVTGVNHFPNVRIDREQTLWADWPDVTATKTWHKGSLATLRFDALVGREAGCIPEGSTILAAKLRVVTGPKSGGHGARVCRVRKSIDHKDVLRLLSEGPEADLTDLIAGSPAWIGRPDLQTLIMPGPIEVDVTADVQSWAGGGRNHGWAFIPWPNGKNGWGFLKPDCRDVANRPTLTVIYIPPSPK